MAENLQLSPPRSTISNERSSTQNNDVVKLGDAEASTNIADQQSITIKNNGGFNMIDEGYINDTDSIMTEEEAVYEEIVHKNYISADVESQLCSKTYVNAPMATNDMISSASAWQPGQRSGLAGNLLPAQEALYINLEAANHLDQFSYGRQTNPTMTGISARRKKTRPSLDLKKNAGSEGSGIYD